MTRTFPSVQAFAAEVDKFDRELERDALKLTHAMAKNAERIAVREARRDLGGDDRFSGWSGGGRELGNLHVKQLRSRTGHVVFPTRKSGGPWKVAEQGRNQGTGGGGKFFGPGLNMRTGRTSYTRTGRVRMRRFGGKQWNGYTAGKNTASRAVVAADKDADRIAEVGLRPIIRKHFDVS